MTDRELLEAAARAAGIEVRWYIGQMVKRDGDGLDAGAWNPLQDDALALRLAVKLGLHLTNSDTYAWASTYMVDATEPLGTNPLAATRRAIVRAAAEIGKGMKPPAPTLPDSLSDEEHVRGLEGRAS